MADNASLSILLELVDKASPQLEAFKKNFASMADTVKSKTTEVSKDGMGSQLASQFQEATGAFAEFATPIIAGLASIQGYLSATGTSWSAFTEVMAKSSRQMFEQNAAMLALSDKLDELGRSAETFSKLSAEERKLVETLSLLGVSTDDLLDQNMALLDSYEYSVSAVGRLHGAFLALVNPVKAAVLAIVAFGTAGIAIGLKGFEMVDKLSDAGAKFGYTATQMLYMSSAAKDAAGSFEGVIGTYTKVAGAMVKAGEDSEKATEAFDRLGVSTTNAVGEMKTASEVAYEIAVKIKEAQEEGQLSAQMMADARTVAGKSIIEEKEAIIAVTEAYKYANEQYEKGIGITKESVAAVNEYEASSTRMSNMWTVISSQFSQIVLPAFSALKDAMVESYNSGGMIYGIFGAIKGATIALMTVIQYLAQVFVGFGAVVTGTTKVVAGFFAGVSNALSAPWGSKGQAFMGAWRAMTDDIKKDALETAATLERLRKIGTSEGTLEKPKTPEIAAPVIPGTPKGGKSGPSETESFINNLKKMADTFNMTTREKTMYDAATIAATMSDKKQAAAFMATTDALSRKLEKLEWAKNAAEEQGRLTDEAIKKDEEERVRIEEAIKSLRLKIEQQEFENTLTNLGTADREAAIMSRELENQKIDVTTTSMKALIERYKEANQVKRDQSQIESILASTTDGKIKKQQEQLVLMSQQLEQGKITEAQWLQSVNVVLNTSADTSEKVSEFWLNAAKSMQNAMSSFFFDIMQGKMSDFAGNFKKMIDKMVADYLAAQVAMALFGDVKSGSKTQAGGGLIGAAMGAMAGMFRAGGGDVNSGAPYIVGEIGPELFVPGRSGTIIPADQTAAMMSGGGRSLSINVTAMDSQDVMRSMDKIKRPLAEMMSGTMRTYNLGAR